MRRLRLWVNKGSVALFGAIWCGMLLYLCIWCPMAFKGDSEALDSVKTYGKCWMGMSGVAFAYLLFMSRSTLRSFRRRGGRVRVGDLHDFLNERKAMFKGLVGGLLCSLPALAITLVGLVVSVPHPEGWVTSDVSAIAANRLMDGVTIQPASDSKRAYLIGIDLSRSSLRSSQDQQLQQVCKALDILLVRERNGASPELIKSEDTESFYIFAENQKPLYISGSALEKPSNSQISRQVCQDLQSLVDQLVDSADDIGRGRTDIVGFLEDMAGKMQSLSDDSHVTLIVFSDFQQNNQASGDLNKRISAVMSELDRNGQQLIGFPMLTVSDSVDRQGKDIKPLLRQHGWSNDGQRSIWKEIPLDTVDRTDIEPRNEFLRSLYSEVRLAGGLHLKYRVFPLWTGTRTYVELPKLPEYGRVLLALRPPEGDNDKTSEISVAFGDSMFHPVVVKMSETASYEVHGNKLPLKLFNPVDISRTMEFDLLVIAPERSITHTVRLVVLPTVGSLPLEMLRWALALAAVTFILLVIGASGADLWFRRKAFWSLRKLGFRKGSRRRSVPAQVKGGVP